MVYADETRPCSRGPAHRLGAGEDHPRHPHHRQHGPSLMAQGKIDLVLLGCDRMAANGDFANKIGTYSAWR